jgi:hypothetical protein
MEQLLWNGTPRIAVSGAGSYLPFPPNMAPNISITPYQLEAGEEKVIADRIFAVLSSPPRKQKNTGAPAANIDGQWDVEMKFAHGMANQGFSFEQDGSVLTGTHYASFAPRDLAGTLHGRDILIRSSYTRNGVRLNFEFTGVVDGDTMQGRVSLGEYGMADWSARKRNYQTPR